ncbi:Phosphoenolpyruvate/pyruvate domain-containing protein [Aspergillus heteromorphus CBS 117.55]|uniref:Phosphoenolpyruvate/pyruvate domain-containing protein n=1 Tax=Aspergillus heteromorphus CBS 117.55 TaxID=1448321 RepID=A0A317WAG8_9EURO|nr:Phosphoenolpyruvate/pyruvate domain-containing protein [Aspergillus heteromorphus CBS 117.55]PWY81998.1 Phosphoenolpyruvate/pyruvate domain-containing protein [Aspergillus heteromorphus CBS 117.55]
MDGTSRVKQVLAQGTRVALGVWQLLPGSNLARILARAGYDWVLVDCEHGNIDDAAMHESVAAVASYGVSPIVRVPDFQSWMIKRALDAGAHGVLAPLVRSVADVRAFVDAARFPPQGRRGFGSPFAMDRFAVGLTASQYLAQANATLLLAVQIETREALDAADAIAAVEGLDLLFVGPFDLGNSIGHPVQDGEIDATLEAAIGTVLRAAHAAGKKAGIYCGDGTQARHYADLGFDLVNVLTDVGALAASLTRERATVTGTHPLGPETRGPYGS